jgi:hypothetical protein
LGGGALGTLSWDSEAFSCCGAFSQALGSNAFMLGCGGTCSLSCRGMVDGHSVIGSGGVVG